MLWNNCFLMTCFPMGSVHLQYQQSFSVHNTRSKVKKRNLYLYPRDGGWEDRKNLGKMVNAVLLAVNKACHSLPILMIPEQSGYDLDKPTFSCH